MNKIEGLDSLRAERLAARRFQLGIEHDRYARHQRIGYELVNSAKAEQIERLQAASREVNRWEADQLCSADYIARWRNWLALPLESLVEQMCSDADGWGTAMRQNSPFLIPGYKGRV